MNDAIDDDEPEPIPSQFANLARPLTRPPRLDASEPTSAINPLCLLKFRLVDLASKPLDALRQIGDQRIERAVLIGEFLG